jgi:hypothetical protein
MKKKKIIPKEGDVFAVPLMQGGYGMGLIAREHKKITLGYFFATIYESLPMEVDFTDINKCEVALIGKFSSMSIEKGEWPVLESIDNFNRSEWPIPMLKMQHPLTEKYYAVIYDDTLINEERYLIDEKEAEKLFNHGLYGDIALQNKLSKILENKK